MKKEIAFIGLMMILGVALGFGLVAILGAIAIPGYTGMILTQAEKADFELMSQQFSWIVKNPYLLTGILILFFITAGVLLFANLNPNFRNKFKEKTARLKAAAVLLGSLACFVLLLTPLFSSSLFPLLYSSFPQTINNTVIFLFFLISSGLLWVIVGETGWAGDFSSWKMGVQGKQARPVASFILGGIIGSAAFGLYYLFNWSFNKYFILVSEVLDKSGETSYLGFKLLANYLMFFLSMSLGIMAGLITAFSPTYKTTRQRAVRLIFPAMLLAVLIPVILTTYQNAVRKYDLGKKNLAEAVGIPEKASVSKAIATFMPNNKTVIQEWPMQANANSFMGTYTIELSHENLNKVKDYIAAHKEGSVYNYAAQDVLVNGYYGLWDIKKGIEQQFKNSGEILLPRLMLISQLRYLPITTDNLNYLKSFTDENKWHIGRALRIAEAFMHFGMVDKAKAWVEKAKSKGEDVSKATFLNDKVLTNGKILGEIKINGKSPANAKVGLLRYSESFEKIDNITLVLRLLDVRNLDATGRVSFNHLGRGEYVLAIMTDKETLPYNLPSEKLHVINSPGAIKLDVNKPNRNLGNINIVVKK
jgi:hypothetical protein